MDRQTIYFGQVPLETDQLKQSQNAMVGLAKLAAGVYGTNTLVNAFTVTPTGPASLNVIVTAGEVYQIANTEASTWSSLATDTHSIVKQGVLLDPLTFGITPPGTVGFSQAFLIEVQYADSDTGSLVLPYYNAANPTSPFSGPGNAGTSQNTVRKGIAAVQVKAGIAAATGSQVTPSADAGWTGIYVVTVANGAATITAGNIVKLASAPFLATNGYLPQIPNGVQQGNWVYGVDTSVVANTIAVTLAPALPAYIAGTVVMVKLANTITGASTLNVNGLGAVGIVRNDGGALSAGDGVAQQLIAFVHDGTNFQIAWRSGISDLIDTAVTFTVHGTTPNFVDLNAAMEYLSKFKIARNGSVLLQLRGAASGTATQFTYSTQVILDHPNSDKITIQGATLIGTPPTDTNFGFTGVIATDAAADLTMLRGVYATEIRFTGGVNFQCYGSPTIKNLLITGDGTALSTFLGVNGGGLAFIAGLPQLSNVSVHGFGGIGIVLNNAYLVLNGSVVSSSGNVNGGDGFELQASSLSSFTTQTISASNAGNGASLTAGSNIPIGLFVFKGNTLTGIAMVGGSAVFSASSKFISNGTFGANVSNGGFCNAQSATWTGNTSGSVQSAWESGAIITGGTGIGTCSPAVNVVGNGNAIIIQ